MSYQTKWKHAMGLNGLPRNKKHELCQFWRSLRILTSWLWQNLHECFLFRGNPLVLVLCELFITHTYSKSPSWYRSSFEWEMITKSSVFRDRLFTLCSWMHTRNSSHFQCICHLVYLRVLSSSLFFLSFSFLFNWHKQRDSRNTFSNSVYRAKEKWFYIIVLCGVSVGLLINDSRSRPTTHAIEQRKHLN